MLRRRTRRLAPREPESSFLTRAATRATNTPLGEALLGGYRTDEDSLRLNIWSPSDRAVDESLPVLVFVHGGSSDSGSGAFPAYDGASLASRGEAIVVTVNYRSGVFGFLAVDALGGDAAGNQGLLDQLAALRWLRDDISASAVTRTASRSRVSPRDRGASASSRRLRWRPTSSMASSGRAVDAWEARGIGTTVTSTTIAPRRRERRGS